MYKPVSDYCVNGITSVIAMIISVPLQSQQLISYKDLKVSRDLLTPALFRVSLDKPKHLVSQPMSIPASI